eukprot:s6207_g1.t1
MISNVQQQATEGHPENENVDELQDTSAVKIIGMKMPSDLPERLFGIARRSPEGGRVERWLALESESATSPVSLGSRDGESAMGRTGPEAGVLVESANVAEAIAKARSGVRARAALGGPVGSRGGLSSDGSGFTASFRTKEETRRFLRRRSGAIVGEDDRRG